MRIRTQLTWLIFAIALLSIVQGATAQEPESTSVIVPRDTHDLRGRLFLADRPSEAPIAIVLHGIPGNENDVLGLGQRLSAAGIHVLVPNYSGTHGSGGEWNMSNDEGDVRAILDYVNTSEIAARFNIDRDRVFLGGYSHGGGVALLYSAKHPHVNDVFSIGGNDFGEWAKKLASDTDFARAIDDLFIGYADAGWVRPGEGADRELPDNVERYDVRGKASDLANRNLLLIGGFDDRTTEMEDHLMPLYRALNQQGANSVRIAAFQDNHAFQQSKDQIAIELIDWIHGAN